MAKLHQTAGLDDTAMELKMTPLIDVVFQLIIFLMCAVHFRTLATTLGTILPVNKEINKPQLGVKQIIITLIHNDRNPMAPAIKLDVKDIANYEELARQLNNIRQSGAEISVIVKPQGQVPTQCVVDALDACKRAGVNPILAE